MAMCPTHKNEFATDRMLSIERPGILAEPEADEDNPCWVCEAINKSGEDVSDEPASMTTRERGKLREAIRKKLFS